MSTLSVQCTMRHGDVHSYQALVGRWKKGACVESPPGLSSIACLLACKLLLCPLSHIYTTTSLCHIAAPTGGPTSLSFCHLSSVYHLGALCWQQAW